MQGAVPVIRMEVEWDKALPLGGLGCVKWLEWIKYSSPPQNTDFPWIPQNCYRKGFRPSSTYAFILWLREMYWTPKLLYGDVISHYEDSESNFTITRQNGNVHFLTYQVLTFLLSCLPSTFENSKRHRKGCQDKIKCENSHESCKKT